MKICDFGVLSCRCSLFEAPGLVGKTNRLYVLVFWVELYHLLIGFFNKLIIWALWISALLFFVCAWDWRGDWFPYIIGAIMVSLYVWGSLRGVLKFQIPPNCELIFLPFLLCWLPRARFRELRSSMPRIRGLRMDAFFGDTILSFGRLTSAGIDFGDNMLDDSCLYFNHVPWPRDTQIHGWCFDEVSTWMYWHYGIDARRAGSHQWLLAFVADGGGACAFCWVNSIISVSFLQILCFEIGLRLGQLFVDILLLFVRSCRSRTLDSFVWAADGGLFVISFVCKLGVAGTRNGGIWFFGWRWIFRHRERQHYWFAGWWWICR